jgi:aspartate/glutamate racemase
MKNSSSGANMPVDKIINATILMIQICKEERIKKHVEEKAVYDRGWLKPDYETSQRKDVVEACYYTNQQDECQRLLKFAQALQNEGGEFMFLTTNDFNFIINAWNKL